jgi:RNA polymerase sigma factor (sigma-70 family)
MSKMDQLNMKAPQEEPKETKTERKKIVAEVFERYHKDLIRWCMLRLNRIYLKKSYISNNPKSDAEEIVALVYQDLLSIKNSVDLTRSGPEIVSFLNIILEQEMNHFTSKIKAQKRIPQSNLISLEELEELTGPKEEYDNRIYAEQAFSKLEQGDEREQRMADILRRRYLLGETQKEVGEKYGVTGDAIRQREAKALEKINKRLRRS